MARFDTLIRYFGTLNISRNVLTNRILLNNQQQIATLKSSTKEKLKSLNIPEKPKRPHSPYLKFLNTQFPEVKKQHPQWSMIELSKQCAQDWKLVDSKTKTQLSEDFHKELLIYEEKKQAFAKSLSKEQADALKASALEQIASKKLRAKRKVDRKHEKPKRPMSSFFFYVKETSSLPENKDKKNSEVIKFCTDTWNTMSVEHKKKYITLTEDDKLRYNSEMEQWEKKMISEGNIEIIRKKHKVISSERVSIPRSKKQKNLWDE